MPLFRGLSAFPITPADERGRVDAAALGRLVGRLAAAGVDSVGLLGSTGGYVYLTRAERRRAVEAAAARLGGAVPLLVGVGALRTDDAADLARDARDAGADGLLLAPVSYAPLTDEEVFHHFAAVAAATDLPLCIYDNPTTTRFAFGDALLTRLAAVPRIVALKTPAPAPAEAAPRIAALRARLPAGFAVGHSLDWHAADALLAGSAAWYSVAGGLLPRPALALLRAARAGDAAEARRIDATLAPLWDLLRRHGGPRTIYAAANLLGLIGAQPPRPLLPLGPPERAAVAAALEGLEA